MSLRIVIICALCLMLLSIANAESVSLPLNSIKKPSNDLITRGGVLLDANQAAVLAGRGEDLSLLNPVENKMWQNKTYAASDSASLSFPNGMTGVDFLSEEAALPFTYMSRVRSRENPNEYYRFSLSRYSHTMLMRSALLRKLGYYVPSPKYYPRLKVVFQNEDEKNEFLKNAQESMISDFESRGWILDDNKNEHSVTFADAVLEPSVAEYFDIHWGYAPDPNNPDQLPAVQRYSRYRAYRALILPFSLVDVPESINRYSAKFGSVLSGHVVMNHPSAESFSACTYEDARWLVRRLAKLQDADLQEIVRAGAFPQELESLVLAKLKHRVHNALELFDLKSELKFNLPDLQKINSSSGLVKNGKVTKEFVPGFPQRFAHGERQSPFQDGDIERHLGIRAKTAAIGTALNHINEQLDLLKVSDLYAGRRQEITDRIFRHIKEKPLEPLYQKVEAWGGPVGGFSLSAARHVTTGTYYGSSAAIQLVDNLSMGARLGYFMAVDGVPNVSPMGGANVMVQRDYTHVRPLLSIKEGTKVPWKDLLVPGFMKKISSVLDDEKTKAQGDAPQRDSLDAFLAELREGEVFTVTDSVVLATYGQLSSSLDVLLGISPMNFMTSVSVGADANRVTLRQTSFMRTRDGIQVYVRAQKGTVLGATLDVNYFLNLLRLRATTNSTELRTDAFIVDYNPEYADLIDSSQSEQRFVKDFMQARKSLKPALRALFKSNDPEILYAQFKHKKFEIDHQLKTKEVRTKLLALRVSKFNEDHLLKIRYPRNPEAPHLDPRDEEITLFSNKKGELKGRDLLGFATDWIEGLINKFSPKARIDVARSEDPNPANTPFGKAHWKMVTTEADLTARGTQYPSVASSQKVWGGWHLSRKKFLKLIDEVQGELKNTPVASYRLIEKEAFANVESVDFYRITAQLSLLPKGLERLRDLILQPSYNGKPVPRAKFLAAGFQKISEKMGRPARANDKAMFEAMLKVLGNGDLQKGRGAFRTQCEELEEKRNGDRSTPGVTSAWIHGSNYECMVPWMNKLIDYSGRYPKDKIGQTRWMTEVLYLLEEQIPLSQLLKYIGAENYIYFVRINGFRAGDEDGDLEYFSNTLGDPSENLDYAAGLINMFATKTGISPIELDRSQGSFR